MKAYRRPAAAFKFPFRFGGPSLATGRLNAPPSGRPSKSMPAMKQFTKLGDPARRKPKAK